MNKKTMGKRDFYMLAILVVLFSTLFLIFKFVIFSGEAATAEIYYGLGDPLVTVDFTNEEVIRNKDQDTNTPINYPLIRENDDTGYIEVIVLGDYKIDGVQQEVIIQIDFVNDRLRVGSEESPLNVCSKQGWSSAVPLICLPNKVRIEFNAEQSDIDFIQ